MPNPNTILTKEFIERWGDKCDIPTTKMKEIFGSLKDTLKEYINEGKEIQLVNMFKVFPCTRSERVKYRDAKSGEVKEKERNKKEVYRCVLAPYLKYPVK